ncbi:MAG: alpha/beta hydrolase [Bdellovibrio sp.]|nr:alpha/beta hydrolase [Bdellovibrio sp.]
MKLFLTYLIYLTVLASCSSVFYYPDRQLYLTPDQIGVTSEDVWFVSKDGTKLNAWATTSPKVQPDQGVVVQFHGNAQNLSSHFANLAWITHHGYRLFTFDYRGYGKSEGKASPEGLIEDGIAAINYAWKNYFLPLKEKNKEARFVIIGQSLGGVVAAQAISKWENRNIVSVLILEGTFSSYRKLAFNKFASRWFTWIFSPIAWAIVHESTASRYVFPDMNYVPVLLIHGTADHIIPLDFGKSIYEMLPAGKKDFWQVEGADHLQTYQHSPEYKEKVVNFIQNL